MLAVPRVSRIFMPDIKIVTIGGGTGHSAFLKGAKAIPGVSLTAVCTVTDRGGSTGMLYREYGAPAWIGDVTKCLMALSPDAEKVERGMERYEHSLAGHSRKNIFLFALGDALGDYRLALDEMHRLYGITGNRVMPVTFASTELVVETKRGGAVRGEDIIDTIAHNLFWDPVLHKIVNAWLDPAVPASPEVLDAIRNADYIVFPPGDLYTSTVPTLLPTGMKDALAETRAKIVIFLNLMTKRGETDRFKGDDFVNEIEKRMDGRKADFVVYNSKPIPESALGKYLHEQKVELSPDHLNSGRKILPAPLAMLDEDGHIRHDPQAITEILQDIIGV